jgi:hypothetical protein
MGGGGRGLHIAGSRGEVKNGRGPLTGHALGLRGADQADRSLSLARASDAQSDRVEAHGMRTQPGPTATGGDHDAGGGGLWPHGTCRWRAGLVRFGMVEPCEFTQSGPVVSGRRSIYF